MTNLTMVLVGLILVAAAFIVANTVRSSLDREDPNPGEDCEDFRKNLF